MGRLLEFYAVDDPVLDAGQVDLDYARRAGRLVAAPSLNSAAFGNVRNWLAQSPLARLFVQDDNTIGVPIRNADLPLLEQSVTLPGPGGAEAITAAVEDAVDEARWRHQGLWIRLI